MPRSLRSYPANSIVHTLNRGNDRKCLYASTEDFEEFLELVAWAKGKSSVRIIAYCLMANHWHFILWPEQPDSISRFLHRLCTTHALKCRRESGSIGEGHIYQGRFHGFVIESEAYYFRALRYVEANPLRAGLVESARDWRWSSLAERLGQRRGIVDDGPLVLPAGWADLVDESLPEAFLEDIRRGSQGDFKASHISVA